MNNNEHTLKPVDQNDANIKNGSSGTASASPNHFSRFNVTKCSDDERGGHANLGFNEDAPARNPDATQSLPLGMVTKDMLEEWESGIPQTVCYPSSSDQNNRHKADVRNIFTQKEKNASPTKTTTEKYDPSRSLREIQRNSQYMAINIDDHELTELLTNEEDDDDFIGDQYECKYWPKLIFEIPLSKFKASYNEATNEHEDSSAHLEKLVEHILSTLKKNKFNQLCNSVDDLYIKRSNFYQERGNQQFQDVLCCKLNVDPNDIQEIEKKWDQLNSEISCKCENENLSCFHNRAQIIKALDDASELNPKNLMFSFLASALASQGILTNNGGLTIASMFLSNTGPPYYRLGLSSEEKKTADTYTEIDTNRKKKIRLAMLVHDGIGLVTPVIFTLLHWGINSMQSNNEVLGATYTNGTYANSTYLTGLDSNNSAPLYPGKLTTEIGNSLSHINPFIIENLVFVSTTAGVLMVYCTKKASDIPKALAAAIAISVTPPTANTGIQLTLGAIGDIPPKAAILGGVVSYAYKCINTLLIYFAGGAARRYYDWTKPRSNNRNYYSKRQHNKIKEI